MKHPVVKLGSHAVCLDRSFCAHKKLEPPSCQSILLRHARWVNACGETVPSTPVCTGCRRRPALPTMYADILLSDPRTVKRTLRWVRVLGHSLIITEEGMESNDRCRPLCTGGCREWGSCSRSPSTPFMIPTTYLILHEVPNIATLASILAFCPHTLSLPRSRASKWNWVLIKLVIVVVKRSKQFPAAIRILPGVKMFVQMRLTKSTLASIQKLSDRLTFSWRGITEVSS